MTLLVLLLLLSNRSRGLGRGRGRDLVEVVVDKELHERPDDHKEVDVEEEDVSVSLGGILLVDVLGVRGRRGDTRDKRRTALQKRRKH